MLKQKLFITLFFLLGAPSAFFPAYSINYCYQPYIGITGGVGAQSGHYRATHQASSDTHSSTIGNTSGFFGGILGVQKYYRAGFFAALQANAFYNTTNLNVRKSSNVFGVFSHSVGVTNNLQYGIDAHLGFSFCNITPYFLIGAEAARWTLRLSNNSPLSERGITAFSALKFSRTHWGPKVGLGLTFPIARFLHANFEFSHTWFGQAHINLIDDATGFSWTHQESISQNAAMLQLKFLL